MRRISTLLLCAAALFAADANRRAPGFSLVDAKGEEHDLADYRGKLVLLNFTQTTCPHCAGVAEVLEQMHQKYGDKIAVVAIVNPPDDLRKVAAYIEGHKLTYPVLFDSGQVAYSYVLSTKMDFPRLYMIDAGGTIRRDYLYGPLAGDIFEAGPMAAEIDKLLGGAPGKK
jgi:peroxiredoxin